MKILCKSSARGRIAEPDGIALSAQNQEVEVIAEDDDGYVAVFVIIPENCQEPEKIKRIFPRYVTLLRTALCELYPGYIRKRVNSQHIKTVG